MPAATLGKFSTDVKLMIQTEVGEVYEPYAHRRGPSCTMPQKRNPISSCHIHACVSVVRQHVAALLDANMADHVRSTGPWDIEWIVRPEMFCLSAGALAQSRFMLEGLEVDPRRMRAKLELTHATVGYFLFLEARTGIESVVRLCIVRLRQRQRYGGHGRASFR